MNPQSTKLFLGLCYTQENLKTNQRMMDGFDLTGNRNCGVDIWLKKIEDKTQTVACMIVISFYLKMS